MINETGSEFRHVRHRNGAASHTVRESKSETCAHVNEFGSRQWEDGASEVLRLCKDVGLERYCGVKPAVIQR